MTRAERPGSLIKLLLRKHGGETDTKIGVSTKKVDRGKDKSPAVPDGTQTRDLSITSPSLYHWAIPAPQYISLRFWFFSVQLNYDATGWHTSCWWVCSPLMLRCRRSGGVVHLPGRWLALRETLMLEWLSPFFCYNSPACSRWQRSRF